MPIVDTSAKTKRDTVANVYTFIDNFGDNTLASALLSFGTSGTVKWNDADTLYSSVGALYNTIIAATTSLTAEEMTANWEISAFVNVPTIRADLILIETALAGLLTLIEDNTARQSFSYIRTPATSH
jgi:hypothetical protein